MASRSRCADVRRGLPGVEQLVRINLTTNKVERVYQLKDAADKRSYLNDVRVDTARQYAYITNSSQGGIRFDWQKGDVLSIDNTLVAHGWDPFEGTRKVLVCMAEAYSE